MFGGTSSLLLQNWSDWITNDKYVCFILLLLSFDRGDTSDKKMLFIVSWPVVVWTEQHISLAFRTVSSRPSLLQSSWGVLNFDYWVCWWHQWGIPVSQVCVILVVSYVTVWQCRVDCSGFSWILLTYWLICFLTNKLHCSLHNMHLLCDTESNDVVSH
jgi:hypothetical protein